MLWNSWISKQDYWFWIAVRRESVGGFCSWNYNVRLRISLCYCDLLLYQWIEAIYYFREVEKNSVSIVLCFNQLKNKLVSFCHPTHMTKGESSKGVAWRLSCSKGVVIQIHLNEYWVTRSLLWFQRYCF